MTARHRLTDSQWELIADLFPPPAKTGRPPTDRRLVVDAILWIMQSGAPWRDLPEDEFCPWETVYGLFNDWNADGTLDDILRRLQANVHRRRANRPRTVVHRWHDRAGAIGVAGGGGKKTIRRNLPITH